MPDRATEPVFLLSLPRSGSTLLQRILGAHSEIATAPEPWVLLPLFYAIREEGVFAEYNHRVAARAVRDLYGRVPSGAADSASADGADAWRRRVRDLAASTYDEVAGGAPFFLDKTPRYSLVLDDLLATFPAAPMVCLWRNPLAVVASLSETWAEGRWEPWLHKVDLFDGLAALVSAVERQPERFLTVRYEDLVASPERVCRMIVERLGLSWEPEVLEAFPGVRLEGTVGDRDGVAAYDAVSRAPLEKWRDTLASPVRRTWCARYLDWIGPGRLERMGYSSDELRGSLDRLETDWARAPRDAWDTVKGVAYNLLEPEITRPKTRSLRRWRTVHNHL